MENAQTPLDNRNSLPTQTLNLKGVLEMELDVCYADPIKMKCRLCDAPQPHRPWYRLRVLPLVGKCAACGLVDPRESLISACLLVIFAVWFDWLLLLFIAVWPAILSIGAAKSFLRGKQEKARNLALRALICGICIALAAPVVFAQLKYGDANMDRVIGACEIFHDSKGRYPKKLDELVPEYIDRIPSAAPGSVWGLIMYSGEEYPLLMWIRVPPFGRKTYSFKTHRYGSLD